MIFNSINKIISSENPEKYLDFFIVGVQKGGTTALGHFLRNHPEVGMSHKKELHFFDNEKFFSKNYKKNYNKLHKNFDFNSNKKVYGEKTPIYMYWDQCIERIWKYNNEAKLIAILRNPIDRAFSHWNMEIDRKKETADFKSCIKYELDRIKEGSYIQHRVRSYVDRGFYYNQITRIYRYFKKDQVLFIKYEDFKNSQELSLVKIFDFLKINNKIKIKFAEVHKRKYHSKISKSEKNLLYEIYKDDITKTEKILDWDCSDWKDLK